MKPLNKLYIAIAFMACVEALSQYLLRTSSASKLKTQRMLLLFLGAFGYAMVGVILWSCYNKNGPMGTVNLEWNGISTILAFVSGYLFFKETITGYDFLGIVFGLLSLYFINKT